MTPKELESTLDFIVHHDRTRSNPVPAPRSAERRWLAWGHFQL